MKNLAVVLIILLSLTTSYGQDFRILQKDKSKIFVTTTRSSDSLLQVAIINADWRIDYVQKNMPYSIRMVEYSDPQDSAAAKPKRKPTHSLLGSDDHHSREQLTHSFYIDISSVTTTNTILRLINSEYRSIMQIDDDSYKLITSFLPDSASEYYVDGYKGTNSAALEVIYLWGAPLRDWSVAFALSVHDLEAKKVLNTIQCMSPTDTELGVRKIKLRQANLLDVMSYADMFCP